MNAIGALLSEISKIFLENIAVDSKECLYGMLIFQGVEMRGSGEYVLQIEAEELGSSLVSLGEIVGEDTTAYPK